MLSKKRKEKQRLTATAAQPAAAVQTAQPATPGAAVASKTSTRKSPAAAAPQYTHIRAELVRIAIVTGVIALILLVLALVSPRL